MAGREYELLGLVAATLRAKGQMPEWYVPTGDVGLAGRIDSDLRADIADAGVTGGEMCVELGREGEARGIMSLGSGGPE